MHQQSAVTTRSELVTSRSADNYLLFSDNKMFFEEYGDNASKAVMGQDNERLE
jgi:hypothetical protein